MRVSVLYCTAVAGPPSGVAFLVGGGHWVFEDPGWCSAQQPVTAWAMTKWLAHLTYVQGASLDDSSTMLVTELCEGGSLARNIMRGRVSWYCRGRKVGGATGDGPIVDWVMLVLPQPQGGWAAQWVG